MNSIKFRFFVSFDNFDNNIINVLQYNFKHVFNNFTFDFEI